VNPCLYPRPRKPRFRWPSFREFFRFLHRERAAVAAGEVLIAEQTLVDGRRAKCYGCDSYLPLTNQCNECTCNIHVKTLFVHEQCPKKFW